LRALGIVGWSGSGKTTLLTSLLPALRQRALRVSAIKHAHSGFDMDRPGKDSYRYREAGAHEVVVVSANRWVMLHEAETDEVKMDDILRRMSDVDIVLVEGFRSHPYSKIEVHRPSLGLPPLWPDHPDILAVATDAPLANCDRVVLPLNRPERIVNWILRLVDLRQGRKSDP
jgi:molybdopterin-guanine dinucleotide biosynthesis protein B